MALLASRVFDVTAQGLGVAASSLVVDVVVSRRVTGIVRTTSLSLISSNRRVVASLRDGRRGQPATVSALTSRSVVD